MASAQRRPAVNPMYVETDVSGLAGGVNVPHSGRFSKGDVAGIVARAAYSPGPGSVMRKKPFASERPDATGPVVRGVVSRAGARARSITTLAPAIAVGRSGSPLTRPIRSIGA